MSEYAGEFVNTKEVYIAKTLILPKYTTTERNALTGIQGMLIYNTTTNKLNFYNGSAWAAVTSA